MSQFINGLGIRHVGENAAKLLDKFYVGDIQTMIASTQELIEILIMKLWLILSMNILAIKIIFLKLEIYKWRSEI